MSKRQKITLFRILASVAVCVFPMVLPLSLIHIFHIGCQHRKDVVKAVAPVRLLGRRQDGTMD